MSADVKPSNEEEPSSNQPDKMRNADMTAEELDKLRAELRLRQKAAMVCAEHLHLLIYYPVVMLNFSVRFIAFSALTLLVWHQ